MTRATTARTRVAAVIGDPVRHSLSPTMHNAAFEALGLDWVYVAFEVPQGGAAGALAAMRAFALGGLSVTMPHKTDVAAACDSRSDDAARLRSVNCVVPRPDGTLHGESTDGPGFLRALTDAGVDVGGRDVLLVGAGGAARAVALALGRAGARLSVSARRSAAAHEVAALADRATVVAWDARTDAARASEVVVNGTPVGMAGDPGLPIGPGALQRDQVVVDMVMHPLDTPLLQAARTAGAQPVDGLGMLAHQAALAFEQWTGVEPPVAVMLAAARAALAA